LITVVMFHSLIQNFNKEKNKYLVEMIDKKLIEVVK